MPRVLPDHPPYPNTMVGWTGTVWHATLMTHRGILYVRGEDQLHSYKAVLAKTKTGLISGADGYFSTDAVPAGEVWHVTNIVARDLTSAVTGMNFFTVHDGVLVCVYNIIAAIPTNTRPGWQGDIWLDFQDFISVYFVGGGIGDTCYVYLCGETFTKEV